MSNTYGITWSAFGLDDNKAFVDDPELWIKEWGTLDATLKQFGYVNYQKSFKSKSDYAILEAGIPKTEIRRDAVKQENTLEGSIYQLQPEVMAILAQRLYDDTPFEYPATSGKWYTRLMFGSELPAIQYYSAILKGKTVDKKAVYLMLRKCMFAAEDYELQLGSDKHAEIKFKIFCMIDSLPYFHNSEWPLVSKYSKSNCGTTLSDATVTISSTTGIGVGDYVYGTGIPDGATVVSIITDTSFELSIIATASGTVTLTFDDISHADRKNDSIARFLFE